MNARNLKKDFDYNLVKVLDAVISAGNVTKASKRLSVTPAAVSIALTRLQLFYNEELFVRGKNGLIP
ncbi:LysR family transcriptional regulator, partial [Klebsiella pneumoniae]